MRNVTIAVTQMACTWDREANIAKACALVRESARRGAGVVLLQELFETPYFCVEKDPSHFAHARTVGDDPAIAALRPVAAELGVVVPVSFFEADGDRHFNSLAMIDADGAVLGVYRKSHIPDFAGYEEAFYFAPGDTGFRVFDTRHGRIGAAVCWDQWFPEAARAMAMAGAEMLLYPTAIGSEPERPGYDSKPHWQRVMRGHAAANLVVVAASNRIGAEPAAGGGLTFYGGSFIADHHGGKVVEAGGDEGVEVATFDLDALAEERREWGLFRTRRPDLYGALGEPAPAALFDARGAARRAAG